MDEIQDTNADTHNPPDKRASPAGNSEPSNVSVQLVEALTQINQNMNAFGEILLNVQDRQENMCQNFGGKYVAHPPGTASHAGKRGHSESSDSDREEVPKRANTESLVQENDAISVTASEDDVGDLLGTTPSDNVEQGDPTADAEAHALLQQLETQLTGNEEKGKPIRQKLADIAFASKRWGSKLDPDKLKGILDSHKQPENCGEVTVPRVDPEIWAQMSTNKKSDDLKISHMQQSLQKCTFCVLNMTEIILQWPDKQTSKSKSEQDSSLVKNCVDTIALLGHVAGELSRLRRENIKPVIKHEFKSICSESSSTSSQLLFGDDLAQRVRDAKKSSRLKSTLSSFRTSTSNPRYNKNVRTNSSSQRYDNNAYKKNAGRSFCGKAQNSRNGRNRIGQTKPCTNQSNGQAESIETISKYV